jgi:GT2 family glycosyltransferase
MNMFRRTATSAGGESTTPPTRGPRGPRISVVVPTWRRPDLLRRCLAALCRQTLSGERYEVLVCDDGPDDDTRALVDATANRAKEAGGPTIRYVPVTATQGPAGARNRGWEQAHGDLIAFTDDDTVPHADWLEQGLAAMGPSIAALSGRVVMPLPDPPTDYALNESGLTTAEFVTANCFVRREALQQVGGFDERFTMAWREDSDLQFKLLQHGYTIARASAAVVTHPLRPAPPGISIRQQRKVYFDALLYRKHPQRYRQHIRAHPPLHYFAIVACLLVMIGAAVMRAPLAGGIAFVVWAALTLAFAWRRLKRTSRAPSHVFEMLLTSIAIPPVSVYWRLLGAWRFRVRFL